MIDRYILDEHGTPTPEPDLYKWAEWMETADRHVAASVLDTVRVSTVFLGLDHSFGASEPLLYETMIFGGDHDSWQARAHTRADAEIIHAYACALAGVVH